MARLPAIALAIFAIGCACSEDGTEPGATGSAAVTASAPPAPVEPEPSAAAVADAAPVDATAAPERDELVVLAGGDVSLGRGVGQRILKDPSYDPFRVVRPLLETADLKLVNLESQLSDQNGETQSKINHLIFTGPPGGADVLARAGIDLVSLANNHAWDYGKKALFETFDNLERAGVAYAGAHRERNRAYEPIVIEKNGWSIAVFAVTHIWNQGPIEKHAGRDYVAWAAFDRLEPQLKAARKKHDLVFVSYHGGAEYVDVPMQWTRDFVHAVMAIGKVDAVFGHHPHVPHGVGWYDQRPVFYSLGNLVFGMHSDHPWTGTSFFARIKFSRSGKPLVEACPYHILGHTPMLFEGTTKEARERAFKSHLRLTSVAVGGTTIQEPGELSCFVLEPPASKKTAAR